ncbi:MAG: helix-turn-helix domain-containing protein [Clostridium sp.]|nr:helix-turn-helix domain-containing protein [Clostridium sp.]
MTKIENEIQYDCVMSRIEELLLLVNENTPATDANSIELGLLSNLAADYEDEHYPMETPSLVDMLKLRMYEMGLTQAALSSLLGINPSRISEYLSGKKEPTLSQARVIVERLKIDPATVLGVSI